MEYNSLKDGLLLQLLKKSDEVAFREIYLRYWQQLYASAYGKTNSRETAEEIVQNIFVGLWEKRSETHIENLPAYLQTAVKYTVISVYRHKIADTRYLEHVKAFTNHIENATEKQVALQELSDAIATSVARMPRKTQEIFTLNRLQNQPVPEISRKLKLPSRTIEYHITQGLRLLRLHLKEFVSFCVTAISLLP